MTLPIPNLDDRRWADLVDEGRGLIPRHAPAWTDFNAHDPGVTILELLAYKTEQELYRLNAVGDVHRRAFMELLGPRLRPAGARPAVALLAYDPDPARRTAVPAVPVGEWFAAWPPAAESDTRPDDDRPAPGERYARPEPDPPPTPDPPPRPPLYRAAHPLAPTGIRVAAVQSFDGRRYRDLTDALARRGAAPAWGEDPARPDHREADRQPALYIGLDPALRVDAGRALTLWYLPDGSAPCLVAQEAVPDPPPVSHPSAPGTFDPAPQVGFAPYDPTAETPSHHGLDVRWEYAAGCGWRPVPRCGFRDETRGLTRAGRLVIPPAALPPAVPPTPDPARVIGAVPVPLFYLRCRLARGLPDAPPQVRGVLPDAVLVEQWDRAETELRPRPRTPKSALALGDLKLGPDVEPDVADAANDLAARGWGPAAAGWAAWPFSDRTVAELRGNDASLDDPRTAPPRADDRRTVPPPPTVVRVPFAVLGVGDGEPNQEFRLRFPDRWPKPGPLDAPIPPDGPPPVVITDSLKVWTMEPSWAWTPHARGPWQPRTWELTADTRLLTRTTAGFTFDPERNALAFGDGETGRVPPPGAVVVAGFRWTAGEAGNVGAGVPWARLADIEPPRPGRPPAAPPVRFRNPLAACGGAAAEELRVALGRLAAEFAAPERLVERADAARACTLDGIDLADDPPPPAAVTLLDFEALARSAPGAVVARARAWDGVDPALPDVAVPGAVTVAVVPRLPAHRPEPTPGLLQLVADRLATRRPIGVRVCVVGPAYREVRVRATVHAARGAGGDARDRAKAAVEGYLHPLTGGPDGRGWPFGRDVHPGELLQVLAGADGVRYVTGLTIAAGDGPAGETAVAVPPRAVVAARVEIDAREDA